MPLISLFVPLHKLQLCSVLIAYFTATLNLLQWTLTRVQYIQYVRVTLA